MKKYFVISDIHSFYTPMIEALSELGFEKDNLNHILIVLGDLFDRGDETIELYKYFLSFDRKRLILIKGNHELLFIELLKKIFPDRYDFTNGTVKTFCQIANFELLKIGEASNKYTETILNNPFYLYGVGKSPFEIWKEIINLVKQSEITKFIKRKTIWKNYFELGKYIFVHSFIPTKINNEFKENNLILDNRKLYEFDSNWRESKFWDQAMWGCPFEQYKIGLFKSEEDKGKILVCGHWHTSDFFKFLDANCSFEHKCGPIYLSPHLIGIDGGVIWSKETGYVHQQNVLVIEEDKIGV